MVYWLISRFDGCTTVAMGPIVPKGVVAIPQNEAEQRMREQLQHEVQSGVLKEDRIPVIMAYMFE